MKFRIPRSAPILAAALGLALTACQSTSVEAPGGGRLRLISPANQTLHIDEPNEISVLVHRDGVPEALRVFFSGLPRGVRVVEERLEIAAGSNLADFTLLAEPGAELVEDHAVRIEVDGDDGLNVAESFEITVRPAKR